MWARLTLLGRALLGLLAERPLSGYDIRRVFTQTPLATFSDSPGAIYPALKRLEAAGLVRGRVERSAGLRNRKIFRVTPAGKAALERWLSEPATRDAVVRDTDELMLRFSFMDRGLGPAASARFLRTLQHELTTYLPELCQYLEANGRKMPQSGRLALESGIRAYDAMLEWTRDALSAYEQRGKLRRKS
jgi:DNA-binding PadR family transcriptional regulator